MLTAKPRLDLTRIEILPFSRATVVNRFTCGKTPIDRFLKNKAKKVSDRSEQRVFCAHLDGSPQAIAYYALQIGTDSVSDIINSKRDYVRNYTAFPAVHLSFLGVHEDYQRQRLGQHLLMDVFTKAAAIAEFAGFYALTLVSYDENSTAFYQSLGFEIYSEGLRQPKMLYPLDDILTLVRGEA